MTAYDAHAADQQHSSRRHADEDVRGPLETRGEPCRSHSLAELLAVGRCEVALQHRLERVSLHELHRAERLARRAREVALARTLYPGRPRHAPTRHVREQQEDRERRQDHESQTPVEEHHHGEHRHEGDAVADQRHGRGDGDVAHLADIADEAVDEVAGTRAVVEAQRESQRVRVDAAANGVHRAGSGECEAHRHEIGRKRPDPRRGEDGHGAHGEQHHDAGVRGRSGGHDGIDHELQRPRLNDADGDLDEHRREPADDEPAIRPQMRAEKTQEAAQRSGLLRHCTAPSGTRRARSAAAKDRSTTSVQVR